MVLFINRRCRHAPTGSTPSNGDQKSAHVSRGGSESQPWDDPNSQYTGSHWGPAPPCPTLSTSNAGVNHNTDFYEIVGEIGESMHEPREVVAMKARCFGSQAPAQGLSEAALNELRAKNVNFMTSMNSKSSAQRTLPKRSRDSYAKKEKWDHLTISLQCVLISCWPCGFLTSGSHQAKSMNQTLLSSYLSSVKNHMMEIGANVDNLKMTMKVLHAKRKGLKSQGKGTRPTWPVA